MKASTSLPRFFLEGALRFEVGEVVAIEGAICHQIGRVLRLRSGQRVVLLDGSTGASEAELVEVGPDRTLARILQAAPCAPEPAVAVTLLAAVLKGERQDWLVQKAVELGVGRIVPLLTERGVAIASGAKPERWRRIAREAAEQCERAVVPEVADPVSLEEVSWTGAKALACTERDGRPLPALLADGDSKLALLVGPEGGWTDAERAWLAERGAIGASLGPRILRAETAALAALSTVMSRLSWPTENPT